MRPKLALPFAIALLLSASTSTRADSPETDALIRALPRTALVAAAPPPDAAAPRRCALAGRERRFTLDGEPVTIFEHGSVEAARAERSRVDCSGERIDDCLLEWGAAPHYFQHGRLVVLHLGSERVARLLASTLGPPFAGDGAACAKTREPPQEDVPGCSAATGPDTADAALAVACHGCLQKLYSGSGLQKLTFKQCVERSTISVRAKLKQDPHYYDKILPKLLKRPRPR